MAFPSLLTWLVQSIPLPAPQSIESSSEQERRRYLLTNTLHEGGKETEKHVLMYRQDHKSQKAFPIWLANRKPSLLLRHKSKNVPWLRLTGDHEGGQRVPPRH